MPKYEFECEPCSVRFERNLKMGDHTTAECPSCHDPAPLVVGSFGFAFEAGKGAKANSGVHDHDYPTADKAVGRSATERWKVVRAREAVKAEARKQGGTHALIRHTGNGHIDYEPMSDAGREARRKLTRAALGPSQSGKS